jgi:hypothetical protein
MAFSTMDPSGPRLAARRALDRRYLRKVIGSGLLGRPFDARAGALGALSPEHGAYALAALAREDHYPAALPLNASGAVFLARDAHLNGSPNGPFHAGESLVRSVRSGRAGFLCHLPKRKKKSNLNLFF